MAWRSVVVWPVLEGSITFSCFIGSLVTVICDGRRNGDFFGDDMDSF